MLVQGLSRHNWRPCNVSTNLKKQEQCSFLEAIPNGLPLNQNSNVLFLRPGVRNTDKRLNQQWSQPPIKSQQNSQSEAPCGYFYPFPWIMTTTVNTSIASTSSHLHTVFCQRCTQITSVSNDLCLLWNSCKADTNIPQQYMDFPREIYNWCFLVISEVLPKRGKPMMYVCTCTRVWKTVRTGGFRLWPCVY